MRRPNRLSVTRSGRGGGSRRGGSIGSRWLKHFHMLPVPMPRLLPPLLPLRGTENQLDRLIIKDWEDAPFHLVCAKRLWKKIIEDILRAKQDFNTPPPTKRLAPLSRPLASRSHFKTSTLRCYNFFVAARVTYCCRADAPPSAQPCTYSVTLNLNFQTWSNRPCAVVRADLGDMQQVYSPNRWRARPRPL